VSKKTNDVLEDPITVFKELLAGERKVFPKYYWKAENALSNAAVITRYMIESLLQWTEHDIKEKLNVDTFKTYKLRGMINLLFGEHTWRAINNAYPSVFYPWELKGSNVGRWDAELRVKAVKWLVEEKLKLPEEHYMYVTANDFDNNGLAGLLTYYNGSPHMALCEAYPDMSLDKDKSTNFGIRTSIEIREMISVIAEYNNCSATEWLEKHVRSEYKRILNAQNK